MISVIIPVLGKVDLTRKCLKSIELGVTQIDEIILIDNGSPEEEYNGIVDEFSSLNIKYIRHEENIGVNYAWNEGVSISNKENPYVCFLNNDVILNKYFFYKIFRCMEDPTVGICIPIRSRRNAAVEGSLEQDNILEDPIVEDSVYIEGWAYTMRRSLLEYIGPISEDFKTFMGDTYYFEAVRTLGYKVVQITNNSAIHFGCQTVDTLFGDRGREQHLIENRRWNVYWKDKKLELIEKKEKEDEKETFLF